jgi:hypothetical protein
MEGESTGFADSVTEAGFPRSDQPVAEQGGDALETSGHVGELIQAFNII